MNYQSLLLILSFFCNTLIGYKAVCIVPVANLFGESMHHRYPLLQEQNIEQLYRFTQAPVNNSDCLRIHQLLFNEQVTVTQEVGNEVCIIVHNVFHDNDFWNGKQSTYWTLKEYLQPLEIIQDQHFLPEQFDHSNLETFETPEQTVFTLKQPFHDPLTRVTYSVRTRFMLLNQAETTVTVARYNAETQSFDALEIPKSVGVINSVLNAEDAAKSVVGLLKEWTQKKEAFPTLLGGCSGTAYVKPAKAELCTYQCAEQIAFKAYCNQELAAPYAGFDSPGLMMSACQIFNVPFCAKNTTTTFRYLRPFNESQDSLEVGDMVMTKGYLGIIVDLQKNLIVEARSNTFHDGIIRVAPLKNTFLGINTYSELLNKCLAKDTLTLMDKKGAGILTLPFTILKFNSIFDPQVWTSPRHLFNWSVN